MLEKVITTRRGVFGRVQIILPLPEKTSLLERIKGSGMSKAEFLRAALILGASQLEMNKPDHGEAAAQQHART
jgi:hypothetical protein